MARESIFGALQRLGVSTFWRDNSTGCKDVCDEQHFEQRANWTDAELCDSTGCFDELLLQDFDALLADPSRDHFIVLHQRGSHGPAYHTDVPQWAKEFFPECDLANLRNCDRAAVNNSYDNTILYTDYFLSRVIDELEKRSGEFATAMLYVSDHGESLGENGLYLHGFPYSMAPREQIEVPMLFWASPAFYTDRANVDPECLRHSAQRDTSHDAIFHTLLPIFGVESPLYDDELDLLAACRANRLTRDGALSGARVQPRSMVDYYGSRDGRALPAAPGHGPRGRRHRALRDVRRRAHRSRDRALVLRRRTARVSADGSVAAQERPARCGAHDERGRGARAARAHRDGWATPRPTRLRAHRQELLFASARCFAAAAIVGDLEALQRSRVPVGPRVVRRHGDLSSAVRHADGAQAIHGCSPAAHPLAGYAWLGVGFALLPLARRTAAGGVGVAFALGTLFGAVQMLRGAHFLSHVLWSAWLVWGVNVALVAACALLPARLRSLHRRLAARRD